MFYVTRGTNLGVRECFFFCSAILSLDLKLAHPRKSQKRERMVHFKQACEFIFLAKKKKKTEYKHCHVGLLEITPSISEKPACSRTEEEMLNK